MVALSACADDVTRASALRQPELACPAVDALAGQRSADPLPANFRPVEAVRCTFRLSIRPSEGPSSGMVWATAQRSTGPLDDLVGALRRPPPEVSGDYACPATMVMPELLALTDAAGATLLPALPGSVCGTPLPEVRSAVDGLHWALVDEQ